MSKLFRFYMPAGETDDQIKLQKIESKQQIRLMQRFPFDGYIHSVAAYDTDLYDLWITSMSLAYRQLNVQGVSIPLSTFHWKNQSQIRFSERFLANQAFEIQIESKSVYKKYFFLRIEGTYDD